MWISLKKIWGHFLETSKCRSKWVINYEPLTLVIKQLRPIRQCICGWLELGLVESETCCWRLSGFHHLRDALITWSSPTCWIWLLIWNGIYTLKWRISVHAERAPESKGVIQQGQAEFPDVISWLSIASAEGSPLYYFLEVLMGEMPQTMMTHPGRPVRCKWAFQGWRKTTRGRGSGITAVLKKHSSEFKYFRLYPEMLINLVNHSVLLILSFFFCNMGL